MWTDDAIHGWIACLRTLPRSYAVRSSRTVRVRGERVITYDTLLRPRTGERIEWDPEAERRLDRVPAPVRAMARIELERTAADRGETRITVALMEEVKARYFGMGAQKT
jgi:Proto-chlorophyllide reductase 57 kD subunit.